MAKGKEDKWLREHLSRLPLESPAPDFTDKIMEKVQALPAPAVPAHTRIRTLAVNILWGLLAATAVGVVLYLYAPKPTVSLEEPGYFPYLSQLLQNTMNNLGEAFQKVKDPGIILVVLAAFLLIIAADQVYKKVTLKKAFLF